jgi:hypothetical protein
MTFERADEAQAQIDVLAAAGFDNLPTDSSWLISVGLLITACSFVGDSEHAARLYDMLLPYRDYFVTVPAVALCTGSAELLLALAAGTTDHWDAADQHFTRAMERNARSRNFVWLVHGKYQYAALLSRRGNPEDRPRLRQLLRDCLARSTEMSMTRVMEQVRKLAKTIGVELQESAGS